MNNVDWIVAVYCILFCSLWYIINLQVMFDLLRITLFEKQSSPVPQMWPRLSVVIAACNEADTIEKALATLLQQDYPSLEIIVVNDRSTDKTGELIDNISHGDDRVKAVHITTLPAGWLGKVHALNAGTKEANGEWILYTDADVCFKQGTLRKAIAFALSAKLDHLTLVPYLHAPSFWLHVVILAFGAMFINTTNAVNAGKPGSDAVVGAGAFNLVKKEALDKTEGFSWLRMEVADDVGLGLMLSRAGAKNSFALALHDISLTWYHSLTDMFKGLEKNIFGVSSHYKLARMMAIVLILWATFFAPVIAIIYSRRVPYLWIFGVAAWLLVPFGALISKVRFRLKFFPLLLTPLGHLLISFMLLYAGVLCKVRGGVIWRGTKYKTGDLRAGQRVKLL
ncbi:MAG: glycosyltransferase [bacterium]